MAKCLVFGANGFIGSHLVDSLITAGHQVRAFDRFRENAEMRFQTNETIDIYSGDFLNRHDIKQAIEDMDYVFHFISTTTPITADEDPLIDVETNIRMSIELLQECVTNGKIKKVIFASTGGAIYGLNSGESINEDVTPLPVSPYAIGKLTIEHYLRYFEAKHGLSSLVFRISNPYGERQSLASKQGVIPIFLQHIAKSEPVTILGDGSMVRDYIYVKDVAHMICESFENAKSNLYNLGSGHGVSVNELVATIQSVIKKDVLKTTSLKPPTFVERIVLDTSRFDNEFNIKPSITLEGGIMKTWEYVVEQQK